MLMCLRMRDEVERKAGLCVSMNGYHFLVKVLRFGL